MIYEMNAIENPDIFKQLKQYLQYTYNFSNEEVITLIGKIQKLIRKEYSEIKKNKEIHELNFSKMKLEDILDID